MWETYFGFLSMQGQNSQYKDLYIFIFKVVCQKLTFFISERFYLYIFYQ